MVTQKTSLRGRLGWGFLLLLVFVNPAGAQTLDSYLQRAAENNPELRASFTQYLAAMERVPQVGSLPDPQLTFGFFTRPMEFSLMGNQRGELSLMQMFPWFGMLRTQKDEASKMARMEYERFREAKSRVFFDVKDTWYQLHRLEAEIRITEQNLEVLRSLERYALARFGSGGTPATGDGGSPGRPAPTRQPDTPTGGGMNSMSGGGQTTAPPGRSGGMDGMRTGEGMGGAMSGSGSGMADVLRVQIEIKEMESELAALQDARRPLLARFNQLLYRNPSEPVVLADSIQALELPADALAGTDSIMKNNPMLRMLDAEKEALAAQEKMGRLEGRPMLGAGVNYMIFTPRPDAGMNEAGMGGTNMVMPMVSVTLPIYRKKFNALQKEARLRQEAVGLQQENAASQLLVQWEDALRDYRNAERRIRLYQEQSTLTQQTLNLLMTAYSVGTGRFDEVLRVQQQLLDYQLRLADTVAAQNTAVAMLEMLAARGVEE
jgi:outer membrane protein TolC